MLGIATFLLALMAPFHLAFGEVTASFRFPLSNFSGPVPSQWARLAVDPERNEVYALNQRGNDIRIFNESGMEIHEFGEAFPFASDIAIGEDGDIFILTRGYQTSAVHLFDYRGEPVSEIAPKNVPAAYSDYTADRLVYRNGSLYLVNSGALVVIVLDAEGYFKEAYDINTALRRHLAGDERLKSVTEDTEWEESRLENLEMTGFHVDRRGNIFFTVSVLFSAYLFSIDGELEEFGKAGSAPGKFGVAAGIVSDDSGYIYVSDRLRSVVLVFDRDFRFQTEFGYRGKRPSNLIVPDDLAIDGLGNVYVAQAANRGVSVFRVAYEDVAPIHEDVSPPYEEISATYEGAISIDEEASKTQEEATPVYEEVSATYEELSASQPSTDGDAKSTVSKEYGPTIEEFLPARREFIDDQNDDTPSADSEKNGRTVEEE
jgi:DNA-binding beta-propeller fold protein YncE